LMQEKVNRSRQHAAVVLRVDSLQRALGMFDAFFRKEVVMCSEDSRQARPALEDDAEHRHAIPPKIPTEPQSLFECLQSQARPLTKRASLFFRGSGLPPSGLRPPTPGSAGDSVSYYASPQRAPYPPACGPLINNPQLGPELQPVAQHCRGGSVQVPPMAPPTGNQSPVQPGAILRSASCTSRGPQSSSNTGRMSSSTVIITR